MRQAAHMVDAMAKRREEVQDKLDKAWQRQEQLNAEYGRLASSDESGEGCRLCWC